MWSGADRVIDKAQRAANAAANRDAEAILAAAASDVASKVGKPACVKPLNSK